MTSDGATAWAILCLAVGTLVPAGLGAVLSVALGPLVALVGSADLEARTRQARQRLEDRQGPDRILPPITIRPVEPPVSGHEDSAAVWRSDPDLALPPPRVKT